MRFASLVLRAVGALVACGCSLGIDEDQIQSAGGAGSTSTAQSAAGPGGTTASATSSSPATSSAQSGATTADTSASSTVTSTSTGMTPPQVVCIDPQGNDLVDCSPGEVCCLKRSANDGECKTDCGAGEIQLECDGPEDCPGQICCAPDGSFGDVVCEDNCADDNIVCKSNADCADICAEPFAGVLGAAYKTCF